MTARRRRGFTLIELLVVVAIIALLISILLPSLGRAREQAKKVYCSNNLAQFGRAVYVYSNEFGYFPPHNPYPQRWWPPGTTQQQIAGMVISGWDPNIGWLLTYGMRMNPPEKFTNGHFKWFILTEDMLPEIVVCPSAKRELMFVPNPEIETSTAIESFVYTYCAFYQSAGTCRSATPLIQTKQGGNPGLGGRNPLIPDPRYGASSKNPQDNAQWGIPYVWLETKTGAPDDPNAGVENQPACWVQAVQPSELDDPGRVYYLADSREYRPRPPGDQYEWPPATINDGWYSGWGNRIYMGTRHFGYPNVLYLDGHAGSENMSHPWPQWNMLFDQATGQAKSDEWRASTFADVVRIANLQSGQHVMPVLMVRGWEYFFKNK